MRCVTESITIAAAPDAVYAVVADHEQLPAWAVGFSSAVRRDAEGWHTTFANGRELPFRLDADEQARTVDFVITTAPGVEVLAPTRVLANGDGAEYLFTLFQSPGRSDEAFAGQLEGLRGELALLKALVEARATT
jgi:Polyketide cyclase / dehydrase and lipid transport